MTTNRYPPSNGSIRCTPKQMAVLRSIVRRNPDGSLMDIYQLMEMHGADCSRMAMRSTLGRLESHGLIERSGFERRASQGRPRRLLAATDAGRAFLRPRNLPSATVP